MNKTLRAAIEDIIVDGLPYSEETESMMSTFIDKGGLKDMVDNIMDRIADTFDEVVRETTK